MIRNLLMGGIVILVPGLPAAEQQANPPLPNRAFNPAPNQQEIRMAMLGGAEWLRAQQLPSGNWTYKGGSSYDLGLTSLVGLALLEVGVPPSDPTIQRALRYVRGELARNAKYALFTYNVSTALLFLERAGDPQDAPLVGSLAAAIRNGQAADGAWGYYVTTGYGADQEKVRGGSDNSNTQFAVIALLAGRKTVEKADDALGRAAQRFIQTQDASGGWRYKGDFGSSVSMTSAGLVALGAAHAVDRVAPSVVAVSPGETRPPAGNPAGAKGAAGKFARPTFDQPEQSLTAARAEMTPAMLRAEAEMHTHAPFTSVTGLDSSSVRTAG